MCANVVEKAETADERCTVFHNDADNYSLRYWQLHNARSFFCLDVLKMIRQCRFLILEGKPALMAMQLLFNQS